ncbi:ATP-binding protein [Streptomyces zingiberis]|uniref:ATP-binding protein n=1 Tax=Streptomyces zingiberis TaxID=2053010 RepID=A0ABX1BWR3_9ACTN|nr:ATP-binding protein [Streptomyces zingiberis]NJQ00881.1 ATP-binding protein [Streptomyces zingiberis]
MTTKIAAAPRVRAHATVPQEPPENWEYSLQLPHDPRGPRIARSTVRTVLAEHGLGDLADRAELLTSELATNAFRYSDGQVAVRLRWRDGTLRVSVWDTSPRCPAPVTAGPHSENGRGLLLLSLCADDWGILDLAKRHPGVAGKVVWFTLARPAQPPAVL